MATIRQFNEVLTDWIDQDDVAPEAEAEAKALFQELAVEFQRQFIADIGNSFLVPPNREFTGSALGKLRAWLERISEIAGVDYLSWCELQPTPVPC